jgi:hypothetical protein
MSEHEKVVDAINALVYEYAHGGTDKVRSIIAAALSSARDAALEEAALYHDKQGDDARGWLDVNEGLRNKALAEQVANRRAALVTHREAAIRIRALRSRPVQVLPAERVRGVLASARSNRLARPVVDAIADALGVNLDATGGEVPREHATEETCPTYGCMQGPTHPGECDPLG